MGAGFFSIAKLQFAVAPVVQFGELYCTPEAISED